jgi:hypothetical protein
LYATIGNGKREGRSTHSTTPMLPVSVGSTSSGICFFVVNDSAHRIGAPHDRQVASERRLTGRPARSGHGPSR